MDLNIDSAIFKGKGPIYIVVRSRLSSTMEMDRQTRLIGLIRKGDDGYGMSSAFTLDLNEIELLIVDLQDFLTACNDHEAIAKISVAGLEPQAVAVTE